MDEILKICKRSTGRTIIEKWNMRTILAQALVYGDDIVLITDSFAKLKQAIVEWKAELERKGMIINEEKSKIMQIGREIEDIQINCRSGRGGRLG